MTEYKEVPMIKKVGVVGAGTMGSGIAALVASAGIPVVLLDIPGKEDRNEYAKRGLERALKARPAAFMDPERARYIEIGNTEDHLEKLRDCDWVVEQRRVLISPMVALISTLKSLMALF